MKECKGDEACSNELECQAAFVPACRKIATCNFDTSKSKKQFMNVDGKCVDECPSPLKPDSHMLRDTTRDVRCHRSCPRGGVISRVPPYDCMPGGPEVCEEKQVVMNEEDAKGKNRS